MEDEQHQGGIDVSWSKITSELKKSLDKDTFQNWIKPIYFESHIDTSLTLSVPTRFLRDWIIKNYASVIKKAYMDQGHSIDKLAILVKEIIIELFLTQKSFMKIKMMTKTHIMMIFLHH